jgi:hypothetical protein
MRRAFIDHGHITKLTSHNTPLGTSFFKPKECKNLPSKLPHPPLSPGAGERGGVRGQKPAKVKSCDVLQMFFAAKGDMASR